MIVVCYKTKTDELKYEICNDVNAWEKEHPDAIIKYAFDEKSCMLHAEADEEEKFTANCRKYDLQPSDFMKVYTNKRTGEKVQLVGILPKSKKYPILIKNLKSDTKYKVTKEYFASQYQ